MAKQMRENPEAKAAVEDAAKRARAIADSFTLGYKERESEIKRASSSKTTAAKKQAGAKPAARKTATPKPVSKKPAAKKPAAKASAK